MARKAKYSAGELSPRERKKFEKLSKPKAVVMPHGGAREGSGRKALFTGKDPVPKSILLTDTGRELLDEAVVRLGASRNDIIEGLIRRHAQELTRLQLTRTAAAA